MDSLTPTQLMKELDSASAAVQEALPRIIHRHRSSGILTWALLHQIEQEVLEDVEADGEHHPQVLRMLRSIPAMGYPNDDSPASFEGHGVISSAFSMIFKAWQRVH